MFHGVCEFLWHNFVNIVVTIITGGVHEDLARLAARGCLVGQEGAQIYIITKMLWVVSDRITFF